MSVTDSQHPKSTPDAHSIASLKNGSLQDRECILSITHKVQDQKYSLCLIGVGVES